MQVALACRSHLPTGVQVAQRQSGRTCDCTPRAVRQCCLPACRSHFPTPYRSHLRAGRTCRQACRSHLRAGRTCDCQLAGPACVVCAFLCGEMCNILTTILPGLSLPLTEYNASLATDTHDTSHFTFSQDGRGSPRKQAREEGGLRDHF